MVTQIPLDEALRRAREGAQDPPRFNMEGKPLLGKERESWKKEIIKRAEDYARWRVDAFLTGVCSHPY